MKIKALFKAAITLILKLRKNTWPMLVSSLKYGRKILKDLTRNLPNKIGYRQQKRRLSILPWYLVLGAPQAGKKTFIEKTGLYFAQAADFSTEAIHYVEQFPDFEWWFSEQAVLIDAMSYDKERDINSWKRFLKLLRKNRANKPLNGILLPINITELILDPNQKRQDLIQDICRYIRDLHETFKSQVPVYLVLTKCDLVEGFVEFFHNISKEELQQIWGMSIPLAECNHLNSVQAFFHKTYSELVYTLKSQVIWAFKDERSLRGRELIHSFPQQMQLLKQPLENFIAELFGATRYQNALHLRGLYFISSRQEGKPFDFLLAAMSKKFQLVPPTFNRPKQMSECYFVGSLLHEAILPEAAFMGDSERSLKIKKWTYKLCQIALPLFIMSSAIGMHFGYQQNLVAMNEVNSVIKQYQQKLTNINLNDPSFTSILPLLDTLNKADGIYQNPSWAMDTLFETQEIKQKIDKTLQRAVHNMLLPRVAAQIESDINQKISDQNLLYATLKGYLAFNGSDYSKRESIKAPIEFDWNKEYRSQDAIENKLKHYLDLSLKEPIDKLPLDQTLINRIRRQLQAIIPSDRAYGLLELTANISDVPDLLINSAVGRNFNDLFINDGTLSIPAIYTHSGFENIFIKNDKNIAEEIAEDNKDIGLDYDNDETQNAEQILLLTQSNYEKNYIQHWQEILNHISITPFNNFQQANDLLTLATSKESPLPKLLNIIYHNTHRIKNDKVHVNEAFRAFNDYSQNSARIDWQKTHQTLTELIPYLNSIATSKNVNQASFEAAKSFIQGNPNPLTQLSEQAALSPQPLKNWLNSIADNAWQIILNGAHNQMNLAWQKDVMSLYDSAIRNRYPLNDVDSQIAIPDFNQFFSNAGKLQNYYDQYLKPFVNDNIWQLYSRNGHSIEIPITNLEPFQRAQKIQNEFFPPGAREASLSFRIKPLLLDANASNIQLTFGDQTLNYSHGPQFPITIHWPFSYNNELSQLLVNAFNHNQYAKTANGPWSLFKILNNGSLLTKNNSNVYEFDINSHGLRASFSILGAAGINVYHLTEIHDFSLPENIAPYTRFTGGN